VKTTILSILSLIAFMIAALAGPPDPKDMKGMADAGIRPCDGGMYVGAYGGANVSQDYGNARTDFTGPGGLFIYHGSTSDHIGGVGGVKVGYNFESVALGGGFRLQPAVEAEAFYLGTKTDVHSQFSPGDEFDLSGHMNNAAAMINGLVRLKTGTFFTPYIGAGIGAEFISFSSPQLEEEGPVFPGNRPVEHNSNVFAPAAQAIGGFDIEIAKHWTLFTEYKYLVAIDPSLDFGNADFGGTLFNLKLDPNELGQHLVTAGVKYNF